MAWNLPALPIPGGIATVANWATKVIDSLRFLKGLDGDVTIENDIILSENVDSSISKTQEDKQISLKGGATLPGRFVAYGKNEGTYPGGVGALVPNAAKTAEVFAFRFSGATDTPEMVEGTIPAARLKTSTGSAVSNLGGGLDVTMNDYSFFPSITNGLGNIALRTFYSGDPVDTIGRFNIMAIVNGISTVRWRYCTSSGPAEIWLGLDVNGKIVAVWESGDPAPEAPPIYGDGIESYYQFSLPLNLFKQIKAEAEGNLSGAILECGSIEESNLILGDYTIEQSQRFTKAEVEEKKQQKIIESQTQQDAVFAKFRKIK